MNRMIKKFADLKKDGKKIFVTYYPLCDTAIKDPIQLARDYFENGGALLEMGLPYEDPCLDGKVIRDSMARALTKNNLDDAFKMVKTIRDEFPNEVIEIMTYIEYVKKIGTERFADLCKDNGVDAVLCPNASLDELHMLDELFGSRDIINLRFAKYTMSEEEIQDLIDNSNGYIFLQASNGVTGVQATTSTKVKDNVEMLKARGIETPIAAGFGISNAKQAKELIDMGADGVIVGSSLVNAIVDDTYLSYIKDINKAINE